MSMVMFVIGCLAVMVGAGMVAFGIPVNEFSFGNTLIVAGTTLATGGLVVVALSAAVSQLHRIAEALSARGPVQPLRPAESLEQPSEARPAPGNGRVPFPPKQPAREPAMREPRPAEPFAFAPPPLPPPAEPAGEERPRQSFAPSLRNPEAAPVTVEDEVSLSPHYQNGGPPAPMHGEPGAPPQPMPSPAYGAGGFEPRHEPAAGEAWRAPPPPAPPREAPSSYFDNMWPAKPSRGPAAEPRAERNTEPSSRETVARQPASAPAAPGGARAGAAILKSGVVDGMAYTLYVDGSIEAELPQGTLRFASIDELRSHLEKNS
jgi:hypothetical protein